MVLSTLLVQPLAASSVAQQPPPGDFRTPDERSRRFFGKPSRAEEEGATFIADGRDEVLTATRENLRMGASQIKIMGGGGGTSSAYDPIDVTQYTLDEMKAAVDAASDWNTYVAVHAYTPSVVRRAIEAGVKCIEARAIARRTDHQTDSSQKHLAERPEPDPGYAEHDGGAAREAQERNRRQRPHLAAGKEIRRQARVGHRHFIRAGSQR